MKADILDSYLTERFASVEKNLEAYGEDMKPKRLHQLRVEIKKIRALLSFLKKTYREQYDISLLKNIFKRAGELRDNQLHVQLLEGQPTSQALLSSLENQKNGRKGAFKKNISNYLSDVSQTRESISLPAEKLNKKKVKKYFKKRLQKARQDLGEAEREKVHHFRKRIKNVRYLYKALPKKLRKKVDLDADYLDKVQEKVGDWHDTHTAIGYISRHTNARQSSDHISRLKEKEEKLFEALLAKVKVKRIAVGA